MENKNKPGIYILQSIKNLRYYIGSTNNIERRFKQHCEGRVKSTKNIRPLNLKVFISTKTLTDARKLEYKLKRQKCRKLIERIIKSKNYF